MVLVHNTYRLKKRLARFYVPAVHAYTKYVHVEREFRAYRTDSAGPKRCESFITENPLRRPLGPSNVQCTPFTMVVGRRLRTFFTKIFAAIVMHSCAKRMGAGDLRGMEPSGRLVWDFVTVTGMHDLSGCHQHDAPSMQHCHDKYFNL